jgi:hypothetical protein
MGLGDSAPHLQSYTFDAIFGMSRTGNMQISPTIRPENTAYTCVSASRLAGKLVLLNAFDSKETPSHRVGVMPCYCDRGTTPLVAANGIVLAAIGAAITQNETCVHLAEVRG